MAPSGPPKAKEAAKAGAKPKPEKKKREDREENPEDKIPKVERPDKEAFEEKQRAKTEEVEKLQTKLRALSAKIQERNTGKDDFQTMRAKIRSQLDEHEEAIKKVLSQKAELQKKIGDKVQEGKQMRQELNKMKKTVGYTSTDQIDERIADIEFTLWTSSVSLKDEKKMLAEMSELKKTKPKVSEVHKKEADVDNFDSGMSIKEQINALNEQMAIHKEKKGKVHEEYKALMEERQKQMGNMPELFEEREALNKSIGALIAERNAIRDAFRKEEREFNAYLAEVRKVRAEKAAEYRAERQKEYEVFRRQREVDKLEENPYVSDLALIDQTVLWCKNLLPKAAAAEEVKKEEKNIDRDGEMVLLKKEDRDEEFFFAPTKKKAGKGKNKKGKEDAGASGNIKHNVETFRFFDQLKLDAPMSVSDIPATLEKLATLKSSFDDKVEAWEAKRDKARAMIAAGKSLEEVLEGDKAEKEEGEEKDKEETPAEES